MWARTPQCMKQCPFRIEILIQPVSRLTNHTHWTDVWGPYVPGKAYIAYVLHLSDYECVWRPHCIGQTGTHQKSSGDLAECSRSRNVTLASEILRLLPGKTAGHQDFRILVEEFRDSVIHFFSLWTVSGKLPAVLKGLLMGTAAPTLALAFFSPSPTLAASALYSRHTNRHCDEGL